MGGLVSKETTYNKLFPFLKKRVLQSPIDFQGYYTTVLELIGDDVEILNHLTSEEIKMLLDKNQVMKIGRVHDLNLQYGLIERKFLPEDYDINHFNNCEEDKMEFKDINGGKLIILSDLASSGKTIILKYFAIRLKEQKKLFWVSFIELSRFRRLFDLFVDKEIDTDQAYTILFNIIRTKSSIEIAIFKKFLIEGQTILFFDGIDEIIPAYTNVLQAMFKVLTMACHSGNQIWISTRPHMSSTYQQLLENQETVGFDPFVRTHQDVFKFAPFTQQEKCNIINQMMEFSGIHEKDQQSKIMEEVLNYFSSLKTEDDHGNDIDNLYMIMAIVEYRLKSSRALDIDSHYDVFEFIIMHQHALAAILPSQRDKSKKLHIWEVHRALALETSFPSITNDSLTILKKWTADKSNWTSDYIQRFGFVYGNINSSFQFVHKSYVDFFVAQFIINFLYGCTHHMHLEEIEFIVDLFIRIMCSYKSDKVCCNFLISFFKSHGRQRNISPNIQQVIFKNLRHIRDPSNIARFSPDILKNFAIFMSSNNALKRKFFRLDDDFNLLDEYVLKGWMESHASTFITAMCESLGPNWHEVFNKSPRKLTPHDIIKKYEHKHDDIEYLKICDYYYNSNDSEAKNRFLNNFYRVPCYSRYVQIDIIERMKKGNRERFLEECFLNICYEHITPQALTLVFQGIVNHFIALRIRGILFYDHIDLTPPLFLASAQNDPEVFELMHKFYTRYAHSWEEIHNLFTFRNEAHIFAPCSFPIYEDYKEYLQKIFENNRWLLKQRIRGLIANGRRMDKRLRSDNAKDLLRWVMFENRQDIEDTLNNLYEKIFQK